jgi:hypothetical protein
VSGFIDDMKAKLGIGSGEGAGKHLDTGGKMKTPQEIADDESREGAAPDPSTVPSNTGISGQASDAQNKY